MFIEIPNRSLISKVAIIHTDWCLPSQFYWFCSDLRIVHGRFSPPIFLIRRVRVSPNSRLTFGFDFFDLAEFSALRFTVLLIFFKVWDIIAFERFLCFFKTLLGLRYQILLLFGIYFRDVKPSHQNIVKSPIFFSHNTCLHHPVCYFFPLENFRDMTRFGHYTLFIVEMSKGKVFEFFGIDSSISVDLVINNPV